MTINEAREIVFYGHVQDLKRYCSLNELIQATNMIRNNNNRLLKNVKVKAYMEPLSDIQICTVYLSQKNNEQGN